MVASQALPSSLGCSCRMPDAPSHITAVTLHNAKTAELKHWIDRVNDEAPVQVGKKNKKLLVKSGRLSELREWLAAYYGIDLSPSSSLSLAASSNDATTPPTVDEKITQRQWGFLRELSDEWERVGDENFRLCSKEAGKSSYMYCVSVQEADHDLACVKMTTWHVRWRPLLLGPTSTRLCPTAT